MKPFEYFEHTADTLFRAYGKTFEEALGNLVLAVYNIIVDTRTVQPVEEKILVIESKSKENVIYDLINELLYFQDTEGFLGSEIEHVTFESSEKGYKASVTIVGDSCTQDYDVFGQIKSATYSQMEIGSVDGNVFIQAVVDL